MMSGCELLDQCQFFNDRLAHRPEIVEVYREYYCMGGDPTCARYRIYATLGSEKIPADLFPHETQRAKNIIENEANA